MRGSNPAAICVVLYSVGRRFGIYQTAIGHLASRLETTALQSYIREVPSLNPGQDAD